MINKALILVLVAGSLLSCHSETKQRHEQINHDSDGEDQNSVIARNLFNYFNNHDWIKMAGLYADTAEFRDPSFGIYPVKQTRQQIVAKYSELSSVFADIHDEVIQLYPSGDRHVIVEFVSSGTDREGNKFELPICSILTIENGKIVSDFTYYDNSGGSN